MAEPSRPLVIVDRFPLPAVTGGRQRMWNFLIAIDSLGPADLLVLEAGSEAAAGAVTARLPSWTVQFAPIPRRHRSVVSKVIEVLRASEPSGLARLDFATAAASLRPVARSRPLIVAIQPISSVLAQLVRDDSPLAVDLWDVEDARLQRVNRVRERGLRGWAPRRLWDERRGAADVRAWRRFNESLVRDADLVTVCSDVDRSALPSSDRVHVVPNGADVRPRHEQRRMHDPPVILYHGQLAYPPNVDAARILVEEVMPRVQRQVPAVQIRLVGRADERVIRLHAPPAVTVTGFVDDIESELERADLLVVPLRAGGGTRLKILEAFSAGLPVVSTTIGAEGLDVINGTHLLIADDPGDIARRAVDLLNDSEMRATMTASAHELVSARYDWRMIQRDLATRLQALLSTTSC